MFADALSSRPRAGGRWIPLVPPRPEQAASAALLHVPLEDRDRHELATVVVDRGRLYTLATSVNEDRWEKVQDLCGRVVRSLNLLI